MDDPCLLSNCERGGGDDADRIAYAAGRFRHERDLQQALHYSRGVDGLVFSHSIDPDCARKFCDPADDWRARCGVSETQSAKLVYLRGGRRADAVGDHSWRRGHRLDVLHALQHDLRELARDYHGWRRFCGRIFFDHHRHEFHDDNPQNARSGADVVPAPAVHLVDVCNERNPGAGHACAGDHARGDVRGAHLGRGRFRSEAGRRPDFVPAHVLVLFASGGLHHDPARHGCDQRIDHLFLAQTDFWLRLCRCGEHGHRGSWISSMGTSHVRERPVRLCRDGLLDLEFFGRDSVGH